MVIRIYFYASVKADRAKKTLEKLVDENGVEHRAEASKADMAAKYFNLLFASSSNHDSFQNIFSDFQPKVSDYMNQQLVREVTKEEIKEAVFLVKVSKAP